MEEEIAIPFTTSEGVDYIIKFTPFSREAVPETISKLVVDITIESKDEVVAVNNASTLFFMSGIIQDYLLKYDVVLYCYCDHSEIIKSHNKKGMLHQEYRSHLFSAMFNRKKSNDYINEQIIIDDPAGNHYIHLISTKDNENVIAQISSLILKIKD